MTNDLISREPVIEWLKTAGHFLKVWHGRKNNDTLKVIGAIINHIEAEPAIDAVPVVRCKDCKEYRNGECEHPVAYGMGSVLRPEPNDFCSYGVREE